MSPLLPGRSWLTRGRLAKWSYQGLGAGQKVRLANGWRIDADLGDYNARMLDLFGGPDVAVVAACRALLRPDDCFFDIGANHGAVGFLCHDRIAAPGCIHLFEPQPALAKTIERTIRQHGKPHMHLHACGLMDREGELKMSCPDGHSGRASFAGSERETTHITLPVKDIRRVIPALAGDRRVTAKVDVEGSEATVVPALLRADRFGFVVFECNRVEDRPVLYDAAREAGASILAIQRGWLRPWLRMIQTPEQFEGAEDYLAVRLDLRPKDPQRIHLRELPRLCDRT